MVAERTPWARLVATLPSLVLAGLVMASVPVQADSDSIPDQLEGELCGRSITRDQIDSPTVPGQCVSSTDLDLSEVEGLPSEVLGIVDTDHDNVPDALEPTVCQVESVNTKSDGYCVGSDYSLQDCGPGQEEILPETVICKSKPERPGLLRVTLVIVTGTTIWL